MAKPEKEPKLALPIMILAVAVIAVGALLMAPLLTGEKGPLQGGSPETSIPNGNSVPSTVSGAPEQAFGKLVVKVVSPNGEPVVGARVALSGPRAIELFTGTLGEVEFYSLETGEYSADVSSSGFKSKAVTAIVSPKKETSLTVELEKNSSVPVSTTSQTEPEAAPSQRSGFSEVKVIEASSRAPIEGATVSLTNSVGKPVETKETIGNGTALFNLPVGGYFATINAAGYYEKKANFVVYENSTVPVLVGLGKKLT